MSKHTYKTNKVIQPKMIIISLLAAIFSLFLLCSCNIHQQEAEPAPEVFSEVCNNGIVKIEACRLIRLPESDEANEFCFLELRVTNNGIAPIYYSNLLCLKASSEGKELKTSGAAAANIAAAEKISGYKQLDGIIDVGEAAEGFIFFEAPADAKIFEISIATDYCNGEWISFTCGAQ